jgi:hypothetical protein
MAPFARAPVARSLAACLSTFSLCQRRHWCGWSRRSCRRRRNSHKRSWSTLKPSLAGARQGFCLWVDCLSNALRSAKVSRAVISIGRKGVSYLALSWKHGRLTNISIRHFACAKWCSCLCYYGGDPTPHVIISLGWNVAFAYAAAEGRPVFSVYHFVRAKWRVAQDVNERGV